MTRALLSVTGPDARSFLQGLITNDIARAERDGIAYAALLTPQGKYLADFFVVAREDGFVLDLPAQQAEGVLRRLALYKLRAKAEIAPAEGLAVRLGTGPAPQGALPDPRHPALGWRLYGSEGGDDGSDWTALRVAHLIPEAGIELIPDDTYILEAGFDRLNGVDFRKGCFVGQEVTARMRHKTVLRKGLVAAELAGPVAPGTPITRDGREIGSVLTQSGPHAIAWLRFDRIGPGMEAGGIALSATSPLGDSAEG